MGAGRFEWTFGCDEEEERALTMGGTRAIMEWNGGTKWKLEQKREGLNFFIYSLHCVYIYIYPFHINFARINANDITLSSEMNGQRYGIGFGVNRETEANNGQSNTNIIEREGNCFTESNGKCHYYIVVIIG